MLGSPNQSGSGGGASSSQPYSGSSNNVQNEVATPVSSGNQGNDGGLDDLPF